MFCPECGKQIKDGAKFCPKCGKEILGLPSEQQSQQQPEKKNGAIPIVIVPIIIALVVGISAVVYVNYRGNRQSENMAVNERQKLAEEEPENEENVAVESPSTEEQEPAAEAQTLEEPTEPTDSQTVPVTMAASVQEKPASSLLYTNQADFRGLSKIVIQKENVIQSSHVVQSNNNIDNTGWSAFDGRSETSWQEGSVDDGVDEFVSADFDQTYDVKIMTFLIGNHRSQEWFNRNNRPKVLRVEMGGLTYSVEFPDEMSEYAVVFSEPISADSITVYIEEVYPGTEYRDTVIAEIGVYRN